MDVSENATDLFLTILLIRVRDSCSLPHQRQRTTHLTQPAVIYTLILDPAAIHLVYLLQPCQKLQKRLPVTFTATRSPTATDTCQAPPQTPRTAGLTLANGSFRKSWGSRHISPRCRSGTGIIGGMCNTKTRHFPPWKTITRSSDEAWRS
ncbi:MAG: hypothetical protein J3Q66DRAFT_331736 [Benniella sp.]|nr:MAG: hypothetical protein J3Q66DRAFT_331736 [Benniella sp.]